MLVFWLGVYICIVALLIAVITQDFINITISVFLLLLLNLNNVDDANWSLFFLIQLFIMLYLFFFLLGLFKKLVWIFGFYFFYFELLRVGVFSGNTLGLDL